MIDAQLPPALARHLAHLGHDARHVAEIGLLSASDHAIGRWARENGAVLISKDCDFLRIGSDAGEAVPLIWVRLGNCTRAAVVAAFDAHLQSAIVRLRSGETVIELPPPET